METWNYRLILRFKRLHSSISCLEVWTCSIVPIYGNADGTNLEQFAPMLPAFESLKRLSLLRGGQVKCRFHMYERDDSQELWSMLRGCLPEMCEMECVEVWAHRHDHAEWDLWEENDLEGMVDSEMWRIDERSFDGSSDEENATELD